MYKNYFRSNQIKSDQIRSNQIKSLIVLLFATFLFSACNQELQELAIPEEKVIFEHNQKFEKWYESKDQEIKGGKNNARTKFDQSVQLTYRSKDVDWTKYKKLNIPSSLEVYEFEFLSPNVVVPFEFKEEFGYEEALARSKQSLLIFARGDEVIKSYVLRYYFAGDKELVKDFKKVNYDAITKNWKGQIDIYSLNETHLVSFDMVIGQVIGTETMELGKSDGSHQSFSSNITCTTTWTPGPCEPHSEGVGITCYDTFTTYCYNTSPPLMTGFPVWNGSGGYGSGGSGDPGDQYLCDSDPNCIPHPDVQIDPTQVIDGFYDLPVNFVLDQNPGILDWQNSTSSERFVHMVNHIYAAKIAGIPSINLRNIFSNWPSNFQSSGPIKGGWANLSYNGSILRVYYEIPIIEPWSIINVQGQRTTNGNNECVIEYSVSSGNLKSVWIVLPSAGLCNYYENLLL